MASRHQPTEVFRFLHARNPIIKIEPPTPPSPVSEVEYALYQYMDHDNLYVQLLNIKTNAEPDWKEQIINAVTEFKSNADAFKNAYDVHRLFPSFAEIYDFLLANEIPGVLH